MNSTLCIKAPGSMLGHLKYDGLLCILYLAFGQVPFFLLLPNNVNSHCKESDIYLY